jgi:peroxiredoxin
MMSGLLMVIGLTLGYPAQVNNQDQETAWSNLTSLYQPVRERAVDSQELQKLSNSLLDKCEEYRNQYPQSPHQDELWAMMFQVIQSLQYNFVDSRFLDELFNKPGLSGNEASLVYQLKLQKISHQDEGSPFGLIPMEKLAREFIDKYPDYDRAYLPLYFVASKAAELKVYPKARELYAECTGLNSKDSWVRKMASSSLVGMDIDNKPFQLKFKDINGKEIDTAKMEWKVVLVYFWSAEVDPSLEDILEINRLYNYHHHEGLEVIGINLDDRKEPMMKVLNSEKIAWPQYFDGKGWENEISSRYGVYTLPTVWLINREGVLVDRDAHNDVANKVVNLLKTQPPNTKIIYPPNPNWTFKDDKELQAYYDKYVGLAALKKGEVLKFIPSKKHEKERYAFQEVSQAGEIYKSFYSGSGVINHNGKLSANMHSANGVNASVVLFALGLDNSYLQEDKELIDKNIFGDWIIASDATIESVAKPLERILSEELGKPVKVSIIEEPKPVLVMEGNYHFQPVLFPLGKDKPVFIYTERKLTPEFEKEISIKKDDFNVKAIDGTLKNLMSYLHQAFNVAVVTDLDSNQKLNLIHANWKKAAEIDKTDWDQLLANITQQTGLTFRREIRTMPVMKIELEKK